MFSYIKSALISLRPWFWLPSIGYALAGYFLFASQIVAFDILAIVVIFGAATAGLSELLNEFFDTKLEKFSKPQYIYGINSSGNVGSMLGLVKEQRIIVLILSSLLIILGITTASLYGSVLVALVMFGQILAIIYSIPPLRLKRFVYGGSTLLFVAYGPVCVLGGSYIYSGVFSVEAIFLSIAIGFFVIGFSTIADVVDRPIDIKNGIHTLATQYGNGVLVFCKSLILLAAVVVGAIKIYMDGGLQPITTAAIVIFFVALLMLTSKMRRNHEVRQLNKIHIWGLLIQLLGPSLIFLL